MAADDNVGSVRCEIWHKLDGGQITDTLDNGDLSAPADETRSLGSFEFSPAPEEPQACALRGYVIPPATGDYTFFISGDDTALLLVSKDESYAGAKIIASVPSYTDVRDFQHYAAQTSRPVHLTAGRHYFAEALLKNGTGPSHVSVGWKLPDGSVQAPIPGDRLIPVTGAVPPPGPHTDRPTLTLKTDETEPKDLAPGFHKFPLGARAEFVGEKMDMSYLLYVPKCYDQNADKLPLFIFLHGNSHQGTDLAGCLNEGPAKYLHNDPALGDWFPMIGLFPQLPGDWRWDSAGAPQIVNALVQALCDKYPRIDRNRIYLTGLSMGGKGTWLTALDAPDTFAAITTFSAVAVRPQLAKATLTHLKNIHIICGGDDGHFANGSQEMYHTLEPVLGSRVQLTVVEHVGHEVWHLYYPNREVYEEMLKFSK